MAHGFSKGGERQRANPAPQHRPRRPFILRRRSGAARLSGLALVACAGAAALALTAGAIGLPAAIPAPAGATPTSPGRVPALSSQFVRLTAALPPSPELFGARVLGAASLSAPLHLQVFF